MAVGNFISQVQFDSGAIRLARADCESIDLPPGLSRMGTGRETYDDAADAALKDRCHGTHPREATREDNLRMLETSA